VLILGSLVGLLFVDQVPAYLNKMTSKYLLNVRNRYHGLELGANSYALIIKDKLDFFYRRYFRARSIKDARLETSVINVISRLFLVIAVLFLAIALLFGCIVLISKVIGIDVRVAVLESLVGALILFRTLMMLVAVITAAVFGAFMIRGILFYPISWIASFNPVEAVAVSYSTKPVPQIDGHLATNIKYEDIKDIKSNQLRGVRRHTELPRDDELIEVICQWIKNR
jgi:hypothetical protein